MFGHPRRTDPKKVSQYVRFYILCAVSYREDRLYRSRQDSLVTWCIPACPGRSLTYRLYRSRQASLVTWCTSACPGRSLTSNVSWSDVTLRSCLRCFWKYPHKPHKGWHRTFFFSLLAALHRDVLCRNTPWAMALFIAHYCFPKLTVLVAQYYYFVGRGMSLSLFMTDPFLIYYCWHFCQCWAKKIWRWICPDE